MDAQGTPAVTVDLTFGIDRSAPDQRRRLLVDWVLEPLLRSWLFWRCGRWFAALMGLVPSGLAAVGWAMLRKYGPLLALFWIQRAELTNTGVRLQCDDIDVDQFGWDEVKAIRFGRGPLVRIALGERGLQPVCARPMRLVAAMRDYGEPPKLQNIPGLPPRTCNALDGLHGLEVHGIPQHPWFRWVSPTEQPGRGFVPVLIAVVLALLGWRWEAVILGAMLLPVLLVPFQLWLLPSPSSCVDWRVEDGQLRITGTRRTVMVPATDIVQVSELLDNQRWLVQSPLLPRGDAVWWEVRLVEQRLMLAVRGGSSQRLLEALRAAAWVKAEDLLSTAEWTELWTKETRSGT